MLIRIWVDDDQPAAGTLQVDGDAPRSFVGLLQLLRLLSEHLGPRPSTRGDLPPDG